MKTLSQLEEKIAKKKYGKDATPVLHKDKSVEGLIAANCPKITNFSLYNLMKEARV